MTSKRVPWLWRRHDASADEPLTWAKASAMVINFGVAVLLSAIAGWAALYYFGTM